MSRLRTPIWINKTVSYHPQSTPEESENRSVFDSRHLGINQKNSEAICSFKIKKCIKVESNGHQRRSLVMENFSLNWRGAIRWNNFLKNENLWKVEKLRNFTYSLRTTKIVALMHFFLSTCAVSRVPPKEIFWKILMHGLIL